MEWYVSAKVIDKEKNFNFRLYTYVPLGIYRVQIFEELNSEVILVPRSTVSMKAKFFLGVVAPTPVPFKLESGEGTTIYINSRWCDNLAMTKGAVTLTRELAMLNALVVEA